MTVHPCRRCGGNASSSRGVLEPHERERCFSCGHRAYKQRPVDHDVMSRPRWDKIGVTA